MNREILYDFQKHWAEAGTVPSELQAQNLRIKILEKHVLLFGPLWDVIRLGKSSASCITCIRIQKTSEGDLLQKFFVYAFSIKIKIIVN